MNKKQNAPVTTTEALTETANRHNNQKDFTPLESVLQYGRGRI